MSKLNKLIIFSFAVVVVVGVIVFSVSAWTNPPGNPPSGGGILYLFNNMLGIGTSTPATLFTVATSTNIFNVLSSGNIGIGTASPNSKLTVNGQISASNNQIVDVASPTALSSVATKEYVDASSGRVTYMGRTTATTNGNMGGLAGANSKCQVNYPGSYICSLKQIVASGATNVVETAWARCDTFLIYAGESTCADYNPPSVTMYSDCTQWGVNESTQRGTSIASTLWGSPVTCNSNLKIHCCK